jgi:hypothetical protein
MSLVRNDPTTVARGLSERMMRVYRNLLVEEITGGWKLTAYFYKALLHKQRQELNRLTGGKTDD